MVPALFFSAFARGEDASLPMPRTDAAMRQKIDEFFKAVENHQIDAAFDQLVKDSNIATRPDDVTTLKAQTQRAVQLFGEIVGHEIVAVNNVGTHLFRVTYLSLGKEYPLRWRFYFYRSAEEWKLIDIRVDDRLVDLFGETPTASDQRPTNWPKSP